MFKQKEIIILRLYVNFMDIETLQQQANNEQDSGFLDGLYKFLEFQKQSGYVALSNAMNPELSFVISKENR